MTKILSNYSGSKFTFGIVKEEIRKRYGDEEVKEYNPYENCLTYRSWLNLGYKIKPGEKAIKSKMLIENIDPKTNKKIKYFKSINLFYKNQVEKID